MVRRLVADVVWRNRFMYLLMFPIVLMVSLIEAAGEGAPTKGLTLSLMMAYAMGPVATITTGALREIRILPVTNRELWMTTCATSTLVIPLFLLAVQMLAVGAVYATQGSAAVAPETVILASLYAFVYSGALLPVGPLLGYASNNIGVRRPRWLWIALTWVYLLVFMGGFGLPFLFAGALPLTVDQFTVPAFAALAVCLTVTGATWAWTPKRGGMARPDQAAQRIGQSVATGHVKRFADGFTGIGRIAWSHVVVSIVVCLVTIAGFVGVWAVFDSDEGLKVFMQRAGLLPFDASYQRRPNDLGDWTVLIAFMLIAGNGVWNPLARQLKVLPLTVREINGLFLLTPLATWTLVWTVLVITHRVVSGTLPDSLRLDLLLFVVGTSALGHMLALSFKRGGTGFQWFLLPLAIATTSILTGALGSAPTVWKSAALAAAGLVAFGVAAFVNHRTLTRSTSSAKAYQRHQLAWGLTGQDVPR